MEAKDGSMRVDFADTYTKFVEHKRIEYAFRDRNAEIVPARRALSSALPLIANRRAWSSSSKAVGGRFSATSHATSIRSRSRHEGMWR